MTAIDELYRSITRATSAFNSSSTLSEAMRSASLATFPRDILESFRALSPAGYTWHAQWLKEMADMHTHQVEVLRGLGTSNLRLWRDLNTDLNRSLATLGQSYRSVLTDAMAFSSIYRDQLQSITAAMAAFANLRMPTDVLKSVVNRANEISSFIDSEDQSNEGDYKVELRVVQDILVREAETAPQRKLSIEGWVSIAFAVFAFLHTTITTDKGITNIGERLTAIETVQAHVRETEQEVYDHLAPRLGSIEVIGPFHVAHRNARVYLSPKTGSRQIGHIYAGQIVELELRKHKWVQVSFFDYRTSTIKTGWLLKKYLSQSRATR